MALLYHWGCLSVTYIPLAPVQRMSYMLNLSVLPTYFVRFPCARIPPAWVPSAYRIVYTFLSRDID